jgi:hypothetical protein
MILPVFIVVYLHVVIKMLFVRLSDIESSIRKVINFLAIECRLVEIDDNS